jgi:hypothetical protein
MMYPRTQYELTQEQLDEILNASRTASVMFLSGGIPIGRSPQENANAAWANLGKLMGFDYMTVRPIEGMPKRFFTAVPSETETQRTERVKREAAEKRQQEIKQLEAEISERRTRLEVLQAAKEGG